MASAVNVLADTFAHAAIELGLRELAATVLDGEEAALGGGPGNLLHPLYVCGQGTEPLRVISRPADSAVTVVAQNSTRPTLAVAVVNAKPASRLRRAKANEADSALSGKRRFIPTAIDSIFGEILRMLAVTRLSSPFLNAFPRLTRLCTGSAIVPQALALKAR